MACVDMAPAAAQPTSATTTHTGEASALQVNRGESPHCAISRKGASSQDNPACTCCWLHKSLLHRPTL